MPTELQAARSKLAAAVAKRDEGKPPATRVVQAQRLATRREAALTKAAAVRKKANEALVLAQKAVDDATIAENEAKENLATAQTELATVLSDVAAEPVDTSLGGTAPWDSVAALLTQLESLPAAIRAGNAETAWASIQENGVAQLRAMVDKNARSRAASCAPPTQTVAQRVADLQPTATAEIGPATGAGTPGQKTWTQRMEEASAAEKKQQEAKGSGLGGLKGIFK